jgi:hypothetical protein
MWTTSRKGAVVCEMPRRQAAARVVPALMALLGAVPGLSFAQLSVVGSANSEYEYDSNVFDQQRGFPPQGLTTSGLSDTMLGYGAKLDATYLVDQQQFRGVVSGERYQYDRFTELNHNEYTLDGAWNWRLDGLFDGLLEVTRVRTMVSLYNLVQAQLALQTEQRETAKIGFQATPDWRLEAGGYTRHDVQPEVGAPDLSLTESSGTGAFKYTGTAGVTAGVSAGYLHGSYGGANLDNGIDIIAVPPDYQQTNFDLTATDVVTGKSSFNGDIGYSRRSSAGASTAAAINSVSGVTGIFDYKRALTGKTTLDLTLSRQINAFLYDTGSEIDTIGGIGANWQATYKVGVALTYNYTYRQLPGQGDAPLGSNRTDRLNYAVLTVDYEALPWLSLKPFAHFLDRRATNYLGGDFSESVVGLQFTVQLQHGVQRPETPFQIQAQ